MKDKLSFSKSVTSAVNQISQSTDFYRQEEEYWSDAKFIR